MALPPQAPRRGSGVGEGPRHGGPAALRASWVLLVEVGDHPRPSLTTREHVCWAWAWLLLCSGGWQHRGVVGEPGLGVGLSRCESHSSLLVFSF